MLRDATEIILRRKGMERVDPFVGFDGATFTNATNTGVIFVVLKPFEERAKEQLTGAMILSDLRERLSVLT